MLYYYNPGYKTLCAIKNNSASFIFLFIGIVGSGFHLAGCTSYTSLILLLLLIFLNMSLVFFKTFKCCHNSGNEILWGFNRSFINNVYFMKPHSPHTQAVVNWVHLGDLVPHDQSIVQGSTCREPPGFFWRN
uniref:Uncharacterized protein n=1 Tax=Cacopsylla melanoneura TaxID=428564 RepID=A0A8D9BBR6_9HEMI